MQKLYYTYIMASQRNGTLYVGVTSDLARRVWEHKEGVYGGFTKKYAVKLLVWYDVFDYVYAAIQREKNIKKWPRKWKLNLIESVNPDWRDLYDEVC
ncbi:GIY-YIG nuclease family protein [Hyphococcus sp.]|uniref:GIY-YIG nuclease family protein n=1 Tax=Hyphococcus sp. TaxID=2038636 RepID=UPI0035C72F8C